MSEKKGSEQADSIPAPVKLLICVAGIWGCFLQYGLLQEGIYKYKSPSGDKFTQTFAMLVLEHGVSSLVALIAMLVFGQRSGLKGLDMSVTMQFCVIAGAQSGAKFSSNESLKHVSFPVQALAKSSKTIPAMLGSFISGKQFSIIQWLAAFGITCGTAAFSLLGKSKAAGSSNLFGIGLLVVALCADGLVASFQEGMRHNNNIKFTPYEHMFLTNLGATLLMAVFSVITGQLFGAFNLCMQDPLFGKQLIMLCLCSGLGQVFIFLTISWFGPDVNAKITTVRKMATVLVSILWYKHSTTMPQWLSVGMVFAAVAAELLEKVLCPKRPGQGKDKKAA